MRLARCALALASLLSGLWLMLRTLGLLAAVVHEIDRWWPALLLMAGVGILLRSVKPGPNIAVSVALMSGGCLAFGITRGVIAVPSWNFIIAGALIIAGLILIRRPSGKQPLFSDAYTERIPVLFRSADITPDSADIKLLKVFVLCGYLELDLRKIVSPKQRRNEPLMIEITAFAGNIKMLVLPDTKRTDHKAFVLRLRNPVRPSMLDKEYALTAEVVATTLAFFGDVEFKELPPSADSGVLGSGPEPGHLSPASR